MSTVPDDMTDERWSQEAGDIGEGWTPGRVPLSGGSEDYGPAFGWLRGSFGIFEGNCQTNFGAMEVSSLTHLKTGFRVALFNLPEYAATAAILAERVGDWSELEADGVKTPEWRAAAKEMYRLWQVAGLICGPLTNSEGKAVWCGTEPMTAEDHARLVSAGEGREP